MLAAGAVIAQVHQEPVTMANHRHSGACKVGDVLEVSNAEVYQCVGGAWMEIVSGGTPLQMDQEPVTLSNIMSNTASGFVPIARLATVGVSGSLTVATAGAGNQAFTLSGVTTNSRCLFSPTSSTAAANQVGVFVASVAANTVNFTFPSTATVTDTYAVFCTNNI
jgi:hypothetical protein